MKRGIVIRLNKITYGVLFLAIFMHHAAKADLVLTGNYYSFQYASLQLDTNESTSIVKFNLGSKINETWAYEGQIGIGGKTSTNDDLMTYGLYMRANKNLHDEFIIYGLAGLGGIYNLGSDSSSDSSFSAGIGAEAIADKSFSLTLEVMQQISTSNQKAFSVGVGWTYYFYKDDSRFNKDKRRIKSIRQYYR